MKEMDMTGLLLQLADFGITGIKVYYSGGGDSGSIESITYTKAQLDGMLDPFEFISDLNEYDDNSNLSKISSSIYSDIEDFANNTILEDIEDWWNNDGGYGSLCIIIPSGKYHIYSNIYITNTESYEHSGDLISKTLK